MGLNYDVVALLYDYRGTIEVYHYVYFNSE